MSLETQILLVILAIVTPIVFIKKRYEVGKKWKSDEGEKLIIAGKEIQCTHCEHDKFEKREGKLITTWLSLLQLNYWNKSARCFVCKNCGFVHWFIQWKKEMETRVDPDQ